MNPGQELDAIVAEKVMGWTKKINENASYDFEREYWETGTGAMPYVLKWHPSIEISDAWEVVLKMESLDFYIQTSYGKNKKNSPITATCEISGFIPKLPRTIDNYMEAYEHSETVPHAICLAALNTMDRIKRRIELI